MHYEAGALARVKEGALVDTKTKCLND